MQLFFDFLLKHLKLRLSVWLGKAELLSWHFLCKAGNALRGASQKYVNIPSEKYIYVHIYMCVFVYIHTYVKWMSTGLMMACHKNGCAPVLFQLVIRMDEYRSYAGLS